MRYTRQQLTDFDTQGTQVAERLFAMTTSGLLVVMLIIGDPLAGLLIEVPARRGRQAPGRQVGIGGFAYLFDGQIQRGRRFFL